MGESDVVLKLLAIYWQAFKTRNESLIAPLRVGRAAFLHNVIIAALAL